MSSPIITRLGVIILLLINGANSSINNECLQNNDHCFKQWDLFLKEMHTKISEIINKSSQLNLIDHEFFSNINKMLINSDQKLNQTTNFNQQIYDLLTLFNELNSIKVDIDNKLLINNHENELNEYLSVLNQVIKPKINELKNRNIELEETNLQGLLFLIKNDKKQAELIINSAEQLTSNVQNSINLNTTLIQQIKFNNKALFNQLNTTTNFIRVNVNSIQIKNINDSDELNDLLMNKFNYFNDLLNNFDDLMFQDEILKEINLIFDEVTLIKDQLIKLNVTHEKINYTIIDFDLFKLVESNYSRKFVEELAEEIRTLADSFNNATWILEMTKDDLLIAEKLLEDVLNTQNKVKSFKKSIQDALIKIEDLKTLFNKSLKENDTQYLFLINNINIILQEIEDSLLPNLQELINKILMLMKDNEELNHSLTKDSETLISNLNKNKDILRQYLNEETLLRAEEELVKKKDKKRAKELLLKAQEIVKDLVPFDYNDEVIEIVEEEISLLIKEIEGYHKEILENIAKLKCA